MLYRYGTVSCVYIAILLFSLYGCSEISSSNEFSGTWELSEASIEDLKINEISIQLQIDNDGNVKHIVLLKDGKPEFGAGRIEGSFIIFDDRDVMKISLVDGKIKLSDPHDVDSWIILKRI